MTITAHTHPPAKVNLFLELLGKRPDGFHEIDTVMVPIDLRDQLRVARRDQPGVSLKVRWIPSKEVIAQRLGLGSEAPAEHLSNLLEIPTGPENLVHRALSGFLMNFSLDGGFDCDLDKCIPAGAGLGGASSDAAAALRCAAALCDVSPHDRRIYELAEQLGSDVPFFLGTSPDRLSMACRARGRGEKLEDIGETVALNFVVVYPAVSLSTAKVYSNAQIPQAPMDATRLIELLKGGETSALGGAMLNRLSDPAKKLAPQIAQVLESLAELGMKTCQVTGSGSACFAIAGSQAEAVRYAEVLRSQLEPGAIVIAARSSHVPASVIVT
jgi:4-diphosphocytidyl-2-C-methyl-D-erythritol kinase